MVLTNLSKNPALGAKITYCQWPPLGESGNGLGLVHSFLELRHVAVHSTAIAQLPIKGFNSGVHSRTWSADAIKARPSCFYNFNNPT